MAAAWTPTPLTADVAAVVGAGRTAFVMLTDGRVLRAGPGGVWDPVGHAEGGPHALLAVPGERALLLATDHGLERLVGGRRRRAGRIPGAVVALAGVGGMTVAATVDRGLFRSEDGGVHWAEANNGLPFQGAGLATSELTTGHGRLVVGHALGVSQSRDAGRRWEPAGAGLPPGLGRLAVAIGGRRLYAEAGGRLFRLERGVWVERAGPAVRLLGADACALYGVTADGRFVWRSPRPGAVRGARDDGLSEAPVALAATTRWRLAALGSGALWRRPAAAPSLAAASARLGPVPAFWSGAHVEVGFHLPAATDVVLALVGADGVEVARLAAGPLDPGAHRAVVPLGGLAPGLFLCRLTAGAEVVSQPVAVLTASA